MTDAAPTEAPRSPEPAGRPPDGPRPRGSLARLLFPGSLVLGALLLFAGLGRPGLWEPWEMDRADLARTLVLPPRVVVGLAAPADEGPLRETIEATCRDLDMAPWFARAPSRGSRGTAAGTRSVADLLAEARAEVVAAVVLDLALLAPEGPDAAAGASWRDAWSKVEEARGYVPNGLVVLVPPAGGPAPEALVPLLAEARVRATWKGIADRFRIDRPDLAAGDDPGWAGVRSEAALPGGVVLLPSADPAAAVDPLASALARARDSSSGIVSFKDEGRTYTVPPLLPWFTAALYGAFGLSEWTTRAGGAVLSFLTLLLLATTTRRRFGERAGALAALVLATTPVFFAQARSIAGEPGGILGLTLVAAGVLEAGGARAGRALATLALGLLVSFLATGLFGLLQGAALAAVVALVEGRRSLRAFAPALLSAALLGAAAAWVLAAPADGFAGQFRFTVPLFSDGPTDHQANFDLAIKQVGFGGFPWSPLYPLAFGLLLLRVIEERDRDALVVTAWLGVSAIAFMGMVRDFHHLHWHGAPAAALGTALFLERVLDRGLSNRFTALLLLLATLILAKELGSSPRPLADLLALDPPFSDAQGLRFPADVDLAPWAIAAIAVASAVLLLHLSRVAGFFEDALGFLLRPGPYRVILGVTAMALPLVWLGRVLGKYAVGMDLDTAKALSPEQQDFAARFLASGDPVVLLSWATLLVVLAVFLFHHLGPGLARGLRGAAGELLAVEGLARPFALAVAAPARLLGFLAGAVGSAAGLAGAALGRIPARAALVLGAATLVALAAHDLYVCVAPEGYFSEVLLDPEIAFVLALAAAAAVLAFRLGGGAAGVAAAAVSVLALALASRLSRDAWHFTSVSLALTGIAAVLFGRLLVPALRTDLPATFLRGGIAAAAALLLLTLPLLDRWDAIAGVLYPDSREDLLRYLLLESRVSFVLYAALLLLPVLHRLPPRFTLAVPRAVAVVERGPVATFALVLAACLYAGAAAFAFYPRVAEHVSQKHIVDTYREATGLAPNETGDRIFKHGSFGAAGRKDVNFYTAGIPEIRDRKTALEVLAATEDRHVAVETAEGTSVRLVPTWDAGGDRDGDGRRDFESFAGVATAVSAGRLEDERAEWEPGSLAGRVLVDARGKTWTIRDNDRTSLALEGPGTPSFSPSRPERSGYVVDDAAAPNHRATAAGDVRTWMMLPVENFSALNHEFRKVAGGAHVPVLDARSSRVLLAASRLLPDEAQQNRYALHTMTRAEFDALDLPGLHRGQANFDDTFRVLGYRMEEEVVSRGKKFVVTTYIECLKAARKSYKIFMHIDRTGTSNRIHGDHWPLNLAISSEDEEDDEGCVGCYRTDHWLPGDVIVDVFEGEVPIGTPSGPQEIWMGFWVPGQDGRLPVKSVEEGRTKHDGKDRVRIGAFQVR